MVETHKPREATLVVAASDSISASADYVCDGTADEVQIQAAIDDLQSKGGTVVLLEGNYSLADGISCTLTSWLAPVKIIGYGAILTYIKATGYCITLELNHSGGAYYQDRNFVVEGLTIVGNADCAGGILLDRACRIVLNRLHVRNFSESSTGYGIRITDSGGDCAEYNVIRDCDLWRNQIGFEDATTNSAANTRIEDTMIGCAAANDSIGVNILGVFARCLLSNVVIHIGLDDSGNDQRAITVAGTTTGTSLISCAVDDHGTTPTGGRLITIESGAAGGLSIVNFQYSSSNTNLVPFWTQSDDYPMKFMQGDESNPSNIYPDGIFESGVDWLTATNVTLTVDASVVKVGAQSLKILCNDAGGAGAECYYEIPEYARYQNKWVTLCFYYQCVTGQSQPQTVGIWDGVGTATNVPTLTKDSAWHYMEVRRLINSAATRLRITFSVNNIAQADTDDILYISGVQLNEGLNGSTYLSRASSYWVTKEFMADTFIYPAPGTDWTPQLEGAGLAQNLAAKKCWIPLDFLRIGDEIVSYKLVGDATEAAALTLDCKLVRINKADPITTTDVGGGGITQITAGGNFDSEAVLTAVETVATDKQYALEIEGTTGAGDSITVMGAEVKINRKG